MEALRMLRELEGIIEKKKVPPQFKKWQIKKGENKPTKKKKAKAGAKKDVKEARRSSALNNLDEVLSNRPVRYMKKPEAIKMARELQRGDPDWSYTLVPADKPGLYWIEIKDL